VRRGAPKACGGPHLSKLAILLQPTVSCPNPVAGVAKMQERFRKTPLYLNKKFR
jgi:hypothetical protein